jgi:hypothetical protein
MAQFRGNAVAETMDQGTPNFAAVTPSDATVYTDIRAIYCVTAGTLSLENSVGATVAIAMTAGQVLPVSPAKVKAATTGTYVRLY